MTTKLELYNDALLMLGTERLSALTDEGVSRRALDEAYAKALAYCLEQGFWNFAMRTVGLVESEIMPAFGFGYAFEKPDDWVRTHSISAVENFNPLLLDWRDENGLWYTNANPLYVRYVSNDGEWGGDLSLWPESYANVVAHRLAIRACRRITGSMPGDDLVRAFERALKGGRGKDSMNEPPAFPETGTWVRSRAGGFSARSRWNGETV